METNLTTVYKLTDKEGNTDNNSHWEVGTERGLAYRSYYWLCPCDVFQAYRDPNLGLFMNYIQINILDPVRLFKAQGEIVVDDGIQVGCRYLKIVEELPIPSWYSSPGIRDKVHEQVVKNIIHKTMELGLLLDKSKVSKEQVIDLYLWDYVIPKVISGKALVPWYLPQERLTNSLIQLINMSIEQIS